MKTLKQKNKKEANSSSCFSGSEKLKDNPKQVPEPPDSNGINTSVSFFVDGMTCMSCANKVETALTNLIGVKKASVDLPKDSVMIHFNPTEINADGLMEAIEAAGYSIIKTNTTLDEGSRKIDDHSFVRNTGPYPYLIGMLASMGIIGFYLGLLTITSDWYNAWEEFKYYRWWLIALSIGFGIQIALYSALRIHLKGRKIKGAKSSLAASGGISTLSMAACCAHYLVAFLSVLSLPFLSIAAAGLAEYQPQFFFLGVVSNLIGMSVMVRLMVKNKIITRDDLIKRFSFSLLRSS